jgi:RNA polymerase sigma-70 factor (ECF subfamily)
MPTAQTFPVASPSVDELTRLLLDARDGDRIALAAFVRGTQPDVWRLAAHLVGPGDADDVTQDVYVRMWRALPRFRGDASARTWLLVIARRACVDALRRRGRQRRLVTPRAVERLPLDTTPTQPCTVARIDEHVALDAMVGELDAERRDAFVLTQMIGCSYDEAALVCGVPVGTIRSRVARARQDLVAALAAVEAV